MRRKLLGFLIGALILAFPVNAQFIGFTSPQTVSSRPYGPANVACTGVAQLASVPNQGQSVHQAILQSDGNIHSGSMVIQGSNDGVNFQTISDTAALGISTNINLRGDGYYSIVQISVICPATGGNFSVFYTGTSVTPGTPTGTTQSTQYSKTLAFAAAGGSSLSNITFQTPYGNSGGDLYFQYSAGTIAAGATITVQCLIHSSAELFTVVNVAPLVNTTAFQQIPISAATCPTAIVTYITGGGGSASFNLDYVFNLPGQARNAGSGAYTHVTTTGATVAKGTGGFLHTLTINTGAAGTISIFDLPAAACTGTPATSVVAVITATTTTVQTLTYDVNALQGICVKASVAMDLTVSSN
jgi:hypothetical protein